MTDYRVERARLRLSDTIHRDPNVNIDTAELCWIDPSGIDANSSGLRPLSDFYAADYRGWQEEDKWFTAEEGLTTVRGLLKHYRRILDDGVDPIGREMSVIEGNVSVLEEVEEVLSAADDAGAYFCIAVSD